MGCMERKEKFCYGVGVLCACLVILMSSEQGRAAELKTGEPFPSLVLPSVETELPDSLLAYRGRKTVLHVFASW